MSALIFVALAVAWAVYLIPQALRHHEASDASRTVEGFSHRLRVLARREPVDRKTARLVVTPGRSTQVVESSIAREAANEAGPVPAAGTMTAKVPTTPMPLEEYRLRRESARAAASRRRRVLGSLIALLIVVAVVTGIGVLPYLALAAPVVLLVAWLVTCRLMVRKEQSVIARSRPVRAGDASGEQLASLADADVVVPTSQDGPLTEEFAVVVDAPEAEPAAGRSTGTSAGWDPVPVTLPTYVAKEPAARRSVRTIDLEGTGVWTSGRSAADSAVARDAEKAERAARAAAPPRDPGAAERRRAAGS